MEALLVAASTLGYVIAALVIVLIAKITLDLVTPFRLDDQVSSKDNQAFGLSLVGYYLGVLIVFTGACYGETYEDQSYFVTLAVDITWALAGILLLNFSRVLLDRAVFHRFSTRKEIIEDRNCGMGAVEFGTYVASALVVAGGISGEGGGPLTALAFYLLGQVSLIVIAGVYQKMTTYDLHRELERDNTAAGVAYAGNIIAMGILMMRGIAGDFHSWGENLLEFAWYLVTAFVLLIAGRYVIDGLLLPGRTLEEEIAEDRNLNAGYLESSVLVGLAGVIFFVG